MGGFWPITLVRFSQFFQKFQKNTKQLLQNITSFGLCNVHSERHPLFLGSAELQQVVLTLSQHPIRYITVIQQKKLNKHFRNLFLVSKIFNLLIK